MSKRIKFWMILIATFTLAATAGVTLAFMFKKAESTNTFVPAQVSCVVHEKMDGQEVTGNTAVGKEKSEIRVENTGNIKAFIRVKLVSYYVDENGSIIGTSSNYPDITTKNDWIAKENHTYYYSNPVDPSGKTKLLCDPVTLEKTQIDGKTVYQVLEVFAEAIQAEPTSAVEGAWGITIKNGAVAAAPFFYTIKKCG